MWRTFKKPQNGILRGILENFESVNRKDIVERKKTQ